MSHRDEGITTQNRRELLIGAAACGGLAASGLGLSVLSFAQAKPHRIDVHHHISPPTWLDAVKKAKLDNPPIANWSVEKSLEDMDKAGIATALTSPTTPQIEFLGKEEAAAICRSSNDYAKKLMIDNPGRFGVFAMLPLPHIDETLKEIGYAFDTLKVDGVGLMTSYGKIWLGDASFAPVWEELNRREAIVYTHPTTKREMPLTDRARAAAGLRSKRRSGRPTTGGAVSSSRNDKFAWPSRPC
jgi:6-methylsalicylate decarboxylase